MLARPQKFNNDQKYTYAVQIMLWFRQDMEYSSNSRGISCKDRKTLEKQTDKRDRIRFLYSVGKWLLGESRALKVGINAG